MLKFHKLTPRFIGPFEILKHGSPVAYQVALPPSLSNLHSVFHISQLKKYVHDLSHVIELDNVQMKENLTYEAQPLRIDDRMVKQLRGKKIWGSASSKDATWELKGQMRDAYPTLFDTGKFRGETSFKGDGIVTAVTFKLSYK